MKELTLKLRIPRLQYKYLEDNGALDEFLAFKMDGKSGTEVLEKVQNKLKKKERMAVSL